MNVAASRSLANPFVHQHAPAATVGHATLQRHLQPGPAASALHRSPRMVAQRERIAATFGPSLHPSAGVAQLTKIYLQGLDQASNYLEYDDNDTIHLEDGSTVTGVILEMVAIAPENRQAGNGQALLDHFVNNIVGPQACYLEVDPHGGMTEQQLTAWYAKAGFTVVGTSMTGLVVVGINVPERGAKKKAAKKDNFDDFMDYFNKTKDSRRNPDKGGGGGGFGKGFDGALPRAATGSARWSSSDEPPWHCPATSIRPLTCSHPFRVAYFAALSCRPGGTA